MFERIFDRPNQSVINKTNQSPSGRAISQLQSIRLSLELSGVRLE